MIEEERATEYLNDREVKSSPSEASAYWPRIGAGLTTNESNSLNSSEFLRPPIIMLPAKIQLLRPDAKIPTRGNDSAAGYDLYTPDAFTLEPGETRITPLGFATEIPDGYWVWVTSRSGLAAKHSVTVITGVFDPDYRGEWKVVLHNLSDKPYEFAVGDRVAQAVPMHRLGLQFEAVESLSETQRGAGGYGSTGR